MNPRGRVPKVPRETLEPLLSSLRSSGLTTKAIARETGYSASWIQGLCCRWQIRKQFKYERAIDEGGVESAPSRVNGKVAPIENASATAATEAKPGDTPPKGSLA